MKRLLTMTFALLLVEMTTTTWDAPLWGQEPAGSSNSAAAVKDETPGIEIGEKLPEIKLKKQDGSQVSIQELVAKKPTAIVFHRSASW